MQSEFDRAGPQADPRPVVEHRECFPVDGCCPAALTSVPALLPSALISDSPDDGIGLPCHVQSMQVAFRLPEMLRARHDLLAEVAAFGEADGAELIVVEHLRQKRLRRRSRRCARCRRERRADPRPRRRPFRPALRIRATSRAASGGNKQQYAP